MIVHGDIRAAATSPMLDLLVDLSQSDDAPRRRRLIADTFDWFTTYTEWTDLGAHLLRQAGTILANAGAAEWNEHYFG
ncbi:MAG: hypothetical protein KDC46_08230 [Thermoleophilia bacterium]|nr:hypothetical protein [Thermoleophilia bacterium]